MENFIIWEMSSNFVTALYYMYRGQSITVFNAVKSLKTAAKASVITFWTSNKEDTNFIDQI